jgi:hypothetical protein
LKRDVTRIGDVDDLDACGKKVTAARRKDAMSGGPLSFLSVRNSAVRQPDLRLRRQLEKERFPTLPGAQYS